MSFIIIEFFDEPSILTEGEGSSSIRFFQTYKEAQEASDGLQDPMIINCGIRDGLLGEEDIIEMIEDYIEGVFSERDPEDIIGYDSPKTIAERIYKRYIESKFKKKYES